MRLRDKSIIIIAITLLLLLLSIFVTADTIFVNGYKALEKSTTERNIKRAVKGIETEIASMEALVKDWGRWDDTYRFIVDRNQQYVESNLVDSTFTSQRLNVIMYIGLDGQIVWAKAYDWDNNEEILLDPQDAARLAVIKPVGSRNAFTSLKKGIVNSSKGPMFVVAGPITDSNGLEKARGVFLIGRYADYVVKERISDMVQLPMDFASWHGDLSADFIEAQWYLSYSDNIYVKPVDDKYVAGYTVLPDIYGEPTLLVRIFQIRDAYHQSQEMLNYFISLLIIAGLLFGAVMMLLIEKNVVNRVAGISSIVNKIARLKDLSIRLPANGRDELADLAADINMMLSTLDQVQSRLWYVGRHDILTGLYNRTYFEEYLEKVKASSEQIQVVVVDVDGLKLINDTLGHDSGDELLRRAAQVLKEACPEDAVIARFGGDEFVVLLKNLTADAVEDICRRIKVAVAKANSSGPGLTLSMSIGFSVGDKGSLSASEMLKEADNYMYRDKLLHSRSNRSSIVQTLKKALEARDFITEGHADRLQELVRLLGKELGLPEARLAELQVFAQFHDIGKVGIPDSILFKPGRLDSEEMAVMQSHSEIGYRIAQSSPDLIFIADWVLKHHEWWNGGGYPLKLKGEDIPLECRILALADAYDAMTNARPYRAALSKAKALAEIEKNAGIQFDPKLAKVFIDILGKLA